MGQYGSGRNLPDHGGLFSQTTREEAVTIMIHELSMRRRTFICSGLMLGLAAFIPFEAGLASGPPPAHLKEHTITIDATKLVPASWWQVPGITPSIWASDPESLDAPKTS